MIDDETLSIVLQWKEEGRTILERNKLQLAEMNAALAFRDALRAAGVIAADAETVATATNTAATEENADAVNTDRHAYELLLPVLAAVGTAAVAVSGGLLSALNPWGSWLKFGIEAAAVLFPFVSILVAATVAMTAFTVSGSAMVVILGSASLGFLTIGAALVLLANHFAWVNNSMAQLKAALTEMGGDLAQSASKPVNRILQFITSLLPAVEARGEAIISWFGARLPNALTSMRVVLRDLAPFLDQFGGFLGKVYDHVSRQFGPMTELIVKFGLGIAQGLIGNLVRLSDWFQQRLPTFGPIASQIFGAVGSAVQWVASNFGGLADFFVKRWPDIVGVAKGFLDSFAKSFGAFNISMQGLGSFDAQGFFKGLGTVLGAVVSVVWDLVRVFAIIIQQAVAALPAAFKVIGDNWTNLVIGFVSDINWLINAWNSLPAPLRGGVTTPLITGPLAPGAASSGPAPTAGKGGNKAAVNIYVQGNSSSDPKKMAQQTANALRKALQP